MTSDKMTSFLDELDELMRNHNMSGVGFFINQPEGESTDVQNVGNITDREQLFRAQFGLSMLKSQMWKQLSDVATDAGMPYAKIAHKQVDRGSINLDNLTDIELDVWTNLLKDDEWEGEVKYD